MKPARKPFVIQLVITTFASLFLLFSVQTAHAGNSISGFVFDKGRNPLADIDVELLDEYYRVVNNGATNGRAKTTATGWYEFNGLNDGNYTVRVLAFRYDLDDQTQYVEAKSISSIPGQTGSMTYTQDFYLQPKKGGLRDAELSVIFAQEVPKAAQQAYKKAIGDYSNRRADAGFAGLQQALTIFPTYYLALMRYGEELYLKKQYTSATQVFMAAAEVNPQSALPYFNAGTALNDLGGKYLKNAKLALEQALAKAPLSPAVLTRLGSVERKLGQSAAAEKHLLLAKKMAPTKVPEIQKELAQLYGNDMKKYKEAADELEQYVKSAKLSSDDKAKLNQQIADLRQKAQTQTAN
ncbi:MAG: carboxypeptidase regulatory-like domain-containing protein [Pyrinomonadaceae bacterium]